MSRNFEKQMAKMLPKQKHEPMPSPFAKFKAPWYLDWWLPKWIFVLGFFCILWKLFDIVVLGRWL